MKFIVYGVTAAGVLMALRGLKLIVSPSQKKEDERERKVSWKEGTRNESRKERKIQFPVCFDSFQEHHNSFTILIFFRTYKSSSYFR